MPEYKFFYPKKILVRSDSVKTALAKCHQKYPKNKFYVLGGNKSSYVYYFGKHDVKLVARLPKQTGGQKKFNLNDMMKIKNKFLYIKLPDNMESYLKSELFNNLIRKVIINAFKFQDDVRLNNISYDDIITFTERNYQDSSVKFYLIVIGCSKESYENVEGDILQLVSQIIKNKTEINERNIISGADEISVLEFYEIYRPLTKELIQLNKIVSKMLNSSNIQIVIK